MEKITRIYVNIINQTNVHQHLDLLLSSIKDYDNLTSDQTFISYHIYNIISELKEHRLTCNLCKTTVINWLIKYRTK